MSQTGPETDEPDYRFTLANERTFLAWQRTALALMAAAVAVVQLVPDGHLALVRRALGVVLGVLGLSVSGTAYARWSANQRAMRGGSPLPGTPMLAVIVLGLVTAGALALLLVVAT